MTDPARARRLVAALLRTEGCTAEESALRLAKARQLAGAAGVRHEYAQLATPEDHGLAAAQFHSARARGARLRPAAPPPTPQQRNAELVQIMVEIIQRLAAERRLALRRHRRWQGRFP